jgi:hypothetical protein
MECQRFDMHIADEENLAYVRWAMHHLALAPDGQSFFVGYGGAFESIDAEQYAWQADLCTAMCVDFADGVNELGAMLNDAIQDAMMRRVAAAGLAEMHAKDPRGIEALLQ